MWEVSWVTIQMMLADLPQTVKKSEMPVKMSGREMAARFRAKNLTP